MSNPKTNVVNVYVVDDKLGNVLENLKDLKGFNFTGTDVFKPSEILAAIKEDESITVLLLDRMIDKDKDAGIKLFKSLGENPKWKEKKGSLQIVHFSDETKAIKDYEIAKDKRIDLSGSISKQDLFNGKPSAIRILKSAHEWACLYREFPIMADPILEECEMLFHPNSHSMREVMKKVLMAGKCWEPVLIQGDSGTGKELVAKAIYTVARKHGEEREAVRKRFKGWCEFFPYNIGSAPSEGNLQYTELFGALKGSATGIEEDRIGIFEKATSLPLQTKPPNNTIDTTIKETEREKIDRLYDGGTIFLDEIGDAPSIIQVSLLRVLQESEIIPLGGFNAEGGQEVRRPVKFRLISASHKNINQKVKLGEFRLDLFYRLNTIQIQIPPLRERKDDIPILVYLFLEKLNKDYEGNKIIKDPAGLFEKLRKYDWPGNVRQLESAVRASYVMSPGNELHLSEEVNKMLDEDSEGKDFSTPEDILEYLKTKPTPLKELAKQYNVRTAKEIGKLFIDRYGGGKRWPSDADAKSIFASKIGAVKKWLGDPEHGNITLKTMKRGKQ